MNYPRIAIVLFLLCVSIAAHAQTSRLSGRLLGADGKPMKAAHIIVKRPNDQAHAMLYAVGADGRFSIAFSDIGFRMIEFVGVDHVRSEIAAVFDDKPQTIELDVRLAAQHWVESFDGVQVICDFNDFSWANGVAMRKQLDGTYIADVPAKDDSVRYQLLHVADGHSVNGTQSVRYQYDGGGDYRSIVTAHNGTATIVFNPYALLRSQQPSAVRFRNASSSAVNVDAVYRELLTSNADLARRITDARGNQSKRDVLNADLDARMKIVERAIIAERDPRVAVVRRAQYLNLAGGLWGTPRDVVREERIRALIGGDVPATSPLLSLNASILPGLLSLQDSSGYLSVLYDIADRHYDDELRFEAARMLAYTADRLDRHRLLRVLEIMNSEFKELNDARLYRPMIRAMLAELLDSNAVPATITGRLVDAGGKPVRDVDVSVKGRWVVGFTQHDRTDANGTFEISTTKRGPVRIVANMDGGYREVVIPVVTAGRHEVTLRPSGELNEWRNGALLYEAAESTTDAGRILALYVQLQIAQKAAASSVPTGIGSDRIARDPVMLLRRLDSAIALEGSSVVRHMMILSHIDIASRLDSSRRSNVIAARERAMQLRAIDEISASSPLWELNDAWIGGVMRGLIARPEDAAKFWEYVDAIEREHPSEHFRSLLLYRIAGLEYETDDRATRERATAAYAQLQSGYRDMPLAGTAAQEHSATLEIGALIPDFRFVSLDDSSLVVSRESMLGKTYLVDVWSTWCLPCVAQRADLDEIHEEFNPRGFEILSVSLDANVDIVNRFRNARYRMPWQNAFSTGGFSSEAARLFNVTRVPRSLLIDRTGHVIARDVRGSTLRRILTENMTAEESTTAGE